MKYLSTETWEDKEIDVATASPEELRDCYNSLLDQSDDGGAFPGSKAAKAAAPYRKKLNELTAARPEIVEYRAKIAEEKMNARLAGKDIAGM